MHRRAARDVYEPSLVNTNKTKEVKNKKPASNSEQRIRMQGEGMDQ